MQESRSEIVTRDSAPSISPSSSRSLSDLSQPTDRKERKRETMHHSKQLQEDLEKQLKNPLIQEKDKRNRTLLMRAAFLGRTDIINKLISAGIKITSDKDIYGYTAFHLAIRGGDLETVQTCLAENISLLNEPTIGGETPIWTAIKLGHDDIVEFILPLGIHLNSKGGHTKKTLLGDHALSSWETSLAELEKCLAESPEKTIVPQKLIIKIAKQHTIFVHMKRIAEQVGVKIKSNGILTDEICLKRERTLTQKAKERGFFDREKISYRDIMRAIIIDDLNTLKSLKPDLDLLNTMDSKTGQTLLIQAVLVKNKPAIVWLLEQGVSANQQNKLGYTPLMAAAWNGSEEIAAYLLRNGAWLRMRDNAHCDALDWASTDSMVKLLHKVSEEQLTELGAKVDLSSGMIQSEPILVREEEKISISPIVKEEKSIVSSVESSDISSPASDSSSILEEKLMQQFPEIQETPSLLRVYVHDAIKREFPGLVILSDRRSSIIQAVNEFKATKDPKKEEELKNIKEHQKLNQFYLHLQQRLNEKLGSAFAVSSGSVKASGGTLGTAAGIAESALAFLPGAGIAAKGIQTTAQVKNQARLRRLARYFVSTEKGAEIFEEIARKITIMYQYVILGKKKLYEMEGWKGDVRSFWASVKQNIEIVKQAVNYQEVLTQEQAIAMQVAARIIDGMQDGQYGLDELRNKYGLYDGRDIIQKDKLITALLKTAVDYGSYQLPEREFEPDIELSSVVPDTVDEVRDVKPSPQSKSSVESSAEIDKSLTASSSRDIALSPVPKALSSLSFLSDRGQYTSVEKTQLLRAEEQLNSLKKQMAELERQLMALSSNKEQSSHGRGNCCLIM